jgi:transposase
MVHKPLSDRAYKCKKYALVIDRDVNAARHILVMGLELTETEPLLICKRISKLSQGREKPTSFRRG